MSLVLGSSREVSPPNWFYARRLEASKYEIKVRVKVPCWAGEMQLGRTAVKAPLRCPPPPTTRTTTRAEYGVLRLSISGTFTTIIKCCAEYSRGVSAGVPPAVRLRVGTYTPSTPYSVLCAMLLLPGTCLPSLLPSVPSILLTTLVCQSIRLHNPLSSSVSV